MTIEQLSVETREVDAITADSAASTDRPLTASRPHYSAIDTIIATVSTISRDMPSTTSDPVNTGMGDRLRAGIPSRYVTSRLGSTQPCIPPGSLNRVPALAGASAGMSPLPGGR